MQIHSVILASLVLLSQTVTELSSGEVYWWSEKLGMIRNVKANDDLLTGEIQGAHGYSKFRIKKKLVEDSQAKTDGAKKAMQQLIGAMKGNANLSELVKDYRKRLQRLTGISLESANEWQAWFQENQDYLVWSDKADHFEIDVEAKKARLPTKEYRKVNPRPERP